MKIFRLILLSSLVLAPSAVIAQSQTVEHGPLPSWVVESEPLPVPNDASGLMFVRKQDILMHLDDAGQWSFVGQRFKVLHPQALELGNIALEWNPAAGKPIVHRVLIHRDGQQIDVLEKADFEILRREGQLEQAMLDGKLTAILRVPDLRVGDEIEFAATTPSHDPSLGEKSFGLLFISPTPPPGRIRLGLSWENGQAPAIKLPSELEKISRRSDLSLDVVADNLKPANLAKDAPPRYNWQRVAEYSDFDHWGAVSATVASLFEKPKQLVPRSAIQDEIRRIATAHTDPMDRAAAALKLVQEQVRYIYVGLDGGNFTPASADETWTRRYGDCKGKTVLLMALLKGLDIEAEAVLVSNAGLDDGLDARLPNPAMFDHVLVRASIGGGLWWLDGTLPGAYGPTKSPLIPYRWVLPLSKVGVSLEKQTIQPLQLPSEMSLFEIDAQDGFEAPARITSTQIWRGVDGLLRYNAFSALTKDQLDSTFRNSLAGDPTWNEIDSISYQFDKKTLASILTISGRGDPHWDDDGDGAYSLSLPGGGFSPPNRRQRPSEQDQSAPFFSAPSYACHVTTLRLPQNTKLENWGFNSTFDTILFGRLYYRMMEKRDDRTIRMVRGDRVEENEISSLKAQKDNGRIADFDNSKANISYDPAVTMQSWGNLRPVPASGDRVWLGDNPPCLPPDVE